MIRAGLSVLFLLGVGSAVKAQLRPSNVTAARVENIAAVPDRSGIRLDLRNTGQRAITAFFVEFSQQGANGEGIPCGGRGADMIDWSDPMPGRNIYVHMRRNWIPPGGKASIDGYPQCPIEAASLAQMNVQLSLIMFDDGTGEGDRSRIESTLLLRQQARNERLKWLSRFTALRSTSDLRVSAQSLYQDLVDATRSAEIDPHEASRQRMAKPVRDELQQLALDITQLAAHNGQLQNNEFVAWRITDLEQRTARLVQGAGSTDVIPK